MTKELKWRLGKLPTPDEVLKLVNDKVITKDEARDILFKTEEVEEKSEDELKAEIKFLKEVIEKLSNGQYSRIVEVVKDYYPIYPQQPWFQPYHRWSDGIVLCSSTNGKITNGSGAGSGTAGATNCAFTSIS